MWASPYDDRVQEHATALADAVVAALPGWVERCVVRILAAWRPGESPPADVMEQARAAGVRAAEDVGPRVRALLAADIDDQRSTPLALVRGAVRYPTEVLRTAGVAEVERDPMQVRLLPDDPYDLSPATFADIDPTLADAGMVWGAAKALAHRRRHAT